MDDEFSPSHGTEVSPEFSYYLAIAKAIFVAAVILFAIGIAGYVAILGLGQLECAGRALDRYYRSSGLLLLPILSLLGLGMVRAMSNPSGERLEKFISIFELHNIPIFEVFSVKITLNLFVFVSTLAGTLLVVCFPIVIMMVDLKDVWGSCVTRAVPPQCAVFPAVRAWSAGGRTAPADKVRAEARFVFIAYT